MLDQAGRKVSVNDILLEERGRIYKVLQTPPTFDKLRLASVIELRLREDELVEHGQQTYVRGSFSFLVDKDKLYVTEEERKALWLELMEPLRPALRAEISARKKEWKNEQTSTIYPQ